MDARAIQAKERMLRLWTALGEARVCADARVTIVTTDQTVVHAASLLANGSQSLFATTQLQTPLGTYPSAVVRASDVLQIDATLSPRQLRLLLEMER